MIVQVKWKGICRRFNLTEHVNFLTHNQNHILDLVITSKSDPWFTTLCVLKSKVRHAENIWKRTYCALDWSSFKFLRNR